MSILKIKYEKAVEDYVAAFEEKHDITLDYWVADFVGTIAVFGDYFISLEDIRLDIDNEVDKTLFFKWYDLSLELALNNEPVINYYSYLKS